MGARLLFFEVATGAVGSAAMQRFRRSPCLPLIVEQSRRQRLNDGATGGYRSFVRFFSGLGEAVVAVCIRSTQLIHWECLGM
jgi:hypothetical protein